MNERRVAILGMGYVGLPLAARMAKAFPTVGFDPDQARIKALRAGETAVGVSASQYRHPNLSFTDREEDLDGCTAFIICVPTPLGPGGDPDLSAVQAASRTVARHIREGGLVVLESTSYPGTTDQVVVPLVEESGLHVGTGFQAAFSPERIDPGNQRFDTSNTPKLVGGLDAPATARAAALYRAALDAPIYEVSSARVAEAAKVLENTFRAVNVALVNELAIVFEKLGIDAWEVIEAAATKPFAFMPHWPGPGVGGHCIPLDPQYLSYKARLHGMEPRFIGLASDMNDLMKFHVVDLLRQELAAAGRPLRGATVAVWGAAYKQDIEDTRESPTEKIVELLEDSGARIRVHDPLATQLHVRHGARQVPIVADLAAACDGADAVVLVTPHTAYKQLDAAALEALRARMANGVFIDSRALYRLRPDAQRPFRYRAIGLPAGAVGHTPVAKR